MNSEIPRLAEQIVEIAVNRGFKIGFAESLTGGLISSVIVGVPGASRCFEGSVVSYSNEVKIRVLGVDEDVIANHGAVSELCAKQMATGTRELLGTDIAVSVTGIAGPTGGSEEKPVGTVYIGFSGMSMNFAKLYRFQGDRESIREQTVLEALRTVLQQAV